MTKTTDIPLSTFDAAEADVDLGSYKLVNVADPAADQDAATKKYVDDSTDGAVMQSLFDAHTILAADTDDNPTARPVDEGELVGRKSGGSIEGLTAGEVRTILNVEDGADMTDAANVDAAGAVMESDFNAHTLLAADTDDTPAALTVDEDRLVGRVSGGSITALTASQVKDLLTVGQHATDDVSNPPTDAELDSAFGTPATVGAGFVATLDDNGAGSNVYLVWSDGANWWYVAGTKAT